MRVRVYVDGFNLYHGIEATRCATFKWLNLRLLVEQFLGSEDRLEEIYYFTALANWRPDSKARHRDYVDALEATEPRVRTVYGVFRERPRSCRACGANWRTHEEKRTDVNLTIQLVHDAHTDCYDKAVVISGDSDIVPAIELVLKSFPSKRVEALIPPNRKAKEVGSACSAHSKIREKHLRTAMLPETVDVGGKKVSRPSRWR